MAHAAATQIWEPGRTVRVGFLTLTIVCKVPTPGDWRPDQWRLQSATGKRYTFTPHFGLEAGWAS